MTACKYGDPLCPCQDGLLCHYEGENPMDRRQAADLDRHITGNGGEDSVGEREPTAQEWAQRRRDWFAATAPYRQMQHHIYSLAIPSYVMLPGGRIERTGDGLTPEMRAIVEKMNEHIDALVRHYAYPISRTTNRASGGE